MKYNKSYKQFLYYSFFGLICLSIDLLVYLFLTQTLGLLKSNSKIISFLLASTCSFILNRKFTFEVKRFKIKQPINFLIIYSISLFFNSLTHDFFQDQFDGLLPFAIATSISVLINFTGQKFWVFLKN
jgi:putative flippase GtrA